MPEPRERKVVATIRRIRSTPLPFRLALALSFAIGLLGGIAAWTGTYYESSDFVQFYAYAPDRWDFVIHLRSDGPLTTYKDVTVRSLQILGFPQTNVSRWTILLRGPPGSLWWINVTRDVGYRSGEAVNEFWRGSPTDGRIIFAQPGLQNVTATLTIYPGRIASADPSPDSGVNVLPKDVDDSWISGRIAIVSFVVGVAAFAIPATVKEFRDLYRDK